LVRVVKVTKVIKQILNKEIKLAKFTEKLYQSTDNNEIKKEGIQSSKIFRRVFKEKM
jgi:hypothetical protein